METTLHRELKALYCSQSSQQEVRVDGYRIDAVARHKLIEIQCGSLSGIRRKVRRLLERHSVTVVKPLAANKLLLRRDRKGGPVVDRRFSPKHESSFSLFEDLVYFVGVFPHRRLTLEVLLIELEEHRRRKRRHRWRRNAFVVDDRRLIRVCNRQVFRSARDLLGLLPVGLVNPFTTGELATAAGVPRWLAQKAGFCLRTTGAALVAGKRKNAWLYTVALDASASIA